MKEIVAFFGPAHLYKRYKIKTETESDIELRWIARIDDIQDMYNLRYIFKLDEDSESEMWTAFEHSIQRGHITFSFSPTTPIMIPPPIPLF